MAPKKKSAAKDVLPPPMAFDDATKAKAVKLTEQLEALYPADKLEVPLKHASAYQLLVAVMLSAQSTDKKVRTIQYRTV